MNKYSLVLISYLIIAGTTKAHVLHSEFKSVKDSTKLAEPIKHLKINNEDITQLTWYQMITEVPKDEYSFFRNTFSASDIPTVGGIAVLTGTLMRFDKSGWVYDKNLYHSSSLFRNTSDVSVYIGNGQFHFILSALFATYGIIDQNQTALKTASNIVEAELSAGLLVQILKRVTGRESPGGSDKSLGDWKFFPSIKEYQKDQPKYYSFPSGHLAATTAVLTVIANDYPQFTWFRPVSYCALGILGISLVSHGMHWYSDLPLGFFIGYSIGNIVAPEIKLSKSKNDSNSSKILLAPALGNNNIGINLAYIF